METSTGSVVTEQMEPIGKQEPVKQLTVTGQYLYDNFIQENDSDKSRMMLIWELAQSADVIQMEGATDNMVKMARKVDLDNGLPEKDENDKRTRGPKEASAMNVRTIVRQVWGAAKFIDPAVQVDAGLDRSTGYLNARVIAKALLEKHRIDWKGQALKTDADRANAALRKQNKAETQALVEVQKDTPRLPDESLTDWNARVLEVAESRMELARTESRIKTAKEVVNKLIEKHGTEVCETILIELSEALGFDLNILSEMSEEEAEKAMREAALAEAMADGTVEEVVEEEQQAA